MNIKIGTEQEKQLILDKYPASSQVISGNGYLVIAVEQTEIIGFAFIFRRKIPAPIEKYEDFINVIEVFKKEDRCKGVASAMVRKCLEEARANGSYQVRAYCDINNIESHNLWLKNQFSISPVKMRDGSICGSYVTHTV